MSEAIAKAKVIVTNAAGLHARPADMFVKTARRFAAQVVVTKDSERVDGKSILSMLTLAAVEGTELQIEASGPDAQDAVEALEELFLKNFTEDLPPKQK